ncbi:MAG: CRISPR system precrRNA processing endoribonuclease RAMP protein Cas6 [Pseudomonadota bacterium]
MLYGKYRFTCRLDDEAVLPPYKGSTFRGVFGHALKRVVCALKRQECEECLLKNRCLYTKVFETRLTLDMPDGSRISTPPHPFVMEPPQTEKTAFLKGEDMACDLLLFGEANYSLPYFVYAFEQMGTIGVGRRINGNRGRFALMTVKSGKKTLYSETDRKLNLSGPVQELVLPDPGIFPTGGQTAQRGRKFATATSELEQFNERDLRVRVRLETPLRLKFENEIRADLPFHVLARAMLRRVSSLLNTWDDGEPALDYKGLIQRAEDIRTVKSSLEWFDWRRYSNRQEREMFMGGMLGSVTYEGKLGEYLPLLDFCEKVHLGKNTSFGLGKVAVHIG